MDAQGHVNNGVHLDYLQDARWDYLLQNGVTDMLEGVLAVEHKIEYRAPIQFSPEPVTVQMVVLERRAVKFRLGYLIIHQGRLCAVASSTMVPFDLAGQKMRRLNPDEVDLLDRYTWQVQRVFRELPNPPLQGRGHEMGILTRFSDVDRQDHVNNVRVLDYFQEGRIAMTTAADPLAARSGTSGSAQGRSLWLLVRQDVEYLRQMTLRRVPYRLFTAVTRIGTTSLGLAAEIVDPDDGTVITRAQHVLVCADDALRPTPISDTLRANLQRFVVEA
ncbi:acyl-CoA thioesterase [Propionibacteriaceae bacterium G1746]